MKVSIVLHEDYAKDGGINIYIRSFIQFSKGISFTYWNLTETEKTITIGNNAVRVIPLMPIIKGQQRIPETIRTIYNIWRNLRKISQHQDVIIFNSCTYFLPYLIRQKKSPTIFISHGYHQTNNLVLGVCQYKKGRIFCSSSFYHSYSHIKEYLFIWNI